MFFLKSTNAKYAVIPPNGHSTATLTLLIQALKSFCALLRCAPLKGSWTWSVTGYAGSPYMHKACHVHRMNVTEADVAIQTPQISWHHVSCPLQNKFRSYAKRKIHKSKEIVDNLLHEIK